MMMLLLQLFEHLILANPYPISSKELAMVSISAFSCLLKLKWGYLCMMDTIESWRRSFSYCIDSLAVESSIR